jgi:hypothetical protein
MSFKAKSYRSSYRTNIRPKLPSDAIKNLDNFQKNVYLNSVEMLNSEEMLSSKEKLDEGTNLARENQINNEFDNFFDTSKNLSIENDDNFIWQNESEQIPTTNNKPFNDYQEINSE